MEKKTTLRTLALLAILTCSIVAPILVQTFMVSASKSSYDSDYMTVSGVLSTDSYALFPFLKKNLTIGFSKYGEMIDYETKVGLCYSDDDAFAPGESKVIEGQWVEGWIINITYVQGGEYKNVWARATYSDYSTGTAGIAGDWKENCTDGSTGTTNRGGRKTSGGAVTDSIKVLYNGPRSFVALLNTAIYDDSTHTTGLVNLTFTIVFNKVKKQVIVFKDIKRTDVGKNIGDMQIEFSNRGQWDLGDGTPPKSYAHFYENQSTFYNGHYQAWYNATDIPSDYNGTYDVCQIIDDDLQYAGWAAYWPKPIIGWVGATQIEANRIVILSSTSTKTQVQNGTDADDYITLDETPISYPQKNSTGIYWIEDPMVFVNNQVKIINGSVTSTMVYYFRGNNSLKFPSGYVPGSTDTVKIVYKYSTEQDDMSAEPNSPFVIGEWAFKSYQTTDIFRAVTVYGITDLYDGEDSNCASHDENKVAAEVQYYLNETFNPYDLYSAVHKGTRRWVHFHNVTSAEVTAERVTFNLTQKPVIKPNDWTEYCNWSEKVEWGGALKTPYRASSLFGGYNYTFYGNEWSSDGTGNITITGDNVPAAGTIIKVLYSTNATWQEERTTIGTFGNTSTTIASGSSGELIPNTIINSTTWTDPFGATYNITILYDAMYAIQLSSVNSTASRTDDLRLTLDIKIRPESGYVKVHNSTYYYADTTLYATNTTFNGNMSVMFQVTPTYTNLTSRAAYKEHLHITGDILLRANHTYVSGTHDAMANYTVVYANLTTNIGGSYEWIVVGKAAATIDSLGAAYVTEAFDSIKEIKVKAAGMDINDTSYGPQAPFVMGRAATGSKADYRDSLERTFLSDDWCRYGTTPGYPISTSNMIFVGGPVAQMGTEYFNEFTAAFFAKSTYVTNNTGCEEAHSDKILALTCWNRNVSGAGYAVLAVYKDLNGTIGLVIWGYDGQDTLYASKWFWDGLGGQPGIQYLQSVNRGVTAIVLKITYSTTDPLHPTASVVERLGTITEKDQHDP